jgi:hypothetical protein
VSKKQNVATLRGNYHYANVYWKEGAAELEFGTCTYVSLDAARNARLNNGRYVCTVKVTTTMEIAQ